MRCLSLQSDHLYAILLALSSVKLIRIIGAFSGLQDSPNSVSLKELC